MSILGFYFDAVRIGICSVNISCYCSPKRLFFSTDAIFAVEMIGSCLMQAVICT